MGSCATLAGGPKVKTDSEQRPPVYQSWRLKSPPCLPAKMTFGKPHQSIYWMRTHKLEGGGVGYG